MFSINKFVLFLIFRVCAASYYEQYKVPDTSADRWESYIYEDSEYLIQNLPANWENANILCGGQFNGTLAVVDTKGKADFLAEALSETQFGLQSVWVGARRESADDPAGYRWSQKVELRRTAMDVLNSEDDGDAGTRFPMWLNRTLVPVPDGGADCVALERVQHDKPVFLDLPCSLERPFTCERKARRGTMIVETKSVRCVTGLYKIYTGMMNWQEAAAYCLLHKMHLANVASMKCLKKIGVAMLKSRPAGIESAWVGARGALGRWAWVDSGEDLFAGADLEAGDSYWPPMRERRSLRQNGCLEVDRHGSHPPVFMEARCDRKMGFICYKESHLRPSMMPPSDDLYYYVLIRQRLYWQHAYDNCQKINGTLASVDSSEMLTQLLLVMGENKNEPVNHIWLSGRLNMSKDVLTNTISYGWFNPVNDKRIPDRMSGAGAGVYMPPWFDDDFNLDSACLNLDRQDHLNGMVYGLPCDTAQYSICLIEKTLKAPSEEPPKNLNSTG